MDIIVLFEDLFDISVVLLKNAFDLRQRHESRCLTPTRLLFADQVTKKALNNLAPQHIDD